MGRFHWVDVDCLGPGHNAPATSQEPCCQSSAYTGMHTGEEVVSKIATLRGHEAPVVDICFADPWLKTEACFLLFVFLWMIFLAMVVFFFAGSISVQWSKSTFRAP